MIESLLAHTCKIKERQEDTRDSWGKFTYAISDDVECLFINEVRKQLREEFAENIVINGSFIMKQAVDEADIIIYDDYEYNIVEGGIIPRRDLLDPEDVNHYEIVVERRRPENEEQVEIKSSIG